MPKTSEIISDIRNKLQTSCLIVERTEAGKPVTKEFISLAKTDLTSAKKLLSKLERGTK